MPFALLIPGTILEAEHQKRISVHGTKKRPDIIVHLPREETGDPRVGNVMAIEVKRRARPLQALNDFHKLDEFCARLQYRIIVFINIDSHRTFSNVYDGDYAERLHCFSVELEHGQPKVDHARP